MMERNSFPGGFRLKILISFDIDGTLEVGDPPGEITMDMVKRAQQSGCIIGSCSDRPPSSQRKIWASHNIEPDFVAPKHTLDDVKARFQADRYIHTGDRETDQQFAEKAGFEFFWNYEGALEPWYSPKE